MQLNSIHFHKCKELLDELQFYVGEQTPQNNYSNKNNYNSANSHGKDNKFLRLIKRHFFRNVL